MEVGVGILGAGTVGSEVLRTLLEDREAISTKTGLDLSVKRVAVRQTEGDRPYRPPAQLLTDDPAQVVEDPDVRIVVEVMGGIDPASQLIGRALELGKPVITANKEVIAESGPDLFAAAAKSGVPLLFEAAVGGGIPIIRPITESLAGESISRILGIVNGTTNYMLTKMTDDGLGYQAALDQAQALGYAEADPTADVSGSDAAAKASILAGLAFGSWIGPGAVFYEGIANLQSRDIGYARELGFVVRLLAIAERVTDSVSVRVHPTLVPLDHPLAGVKGAQNAIYVEGPRIDRLLFTGPGAGGAPTATAVLGDLIDASRELLAGAPVSPRIRVARVRALDFGEVISSWYVRLEVADRPGVLAAIAGVFGQHQVSIRSVRQEGRGEDATLLLVTHETTEARHQAAVEELRGVDVVREVASVLRVLDADV